MKVYALCNECDDYYYGFVAPSCVFTSKEKAIAEGKKLATECAEEWGEEGSSLKIETPRENQTLIYCTRFCAELGKEISSSPTYAVFEYEVIE